jgi:hypothetical protein
VAVLPRSPTGYVRRHGEALAKTTDRARAWVARHAFLTAWAGLSVVVAGLLLWSGQGPAGAVVFGVAVGFAAVVAPYLFDPIPIPLAREQWPMRVPILRRLGRLRSWINPFYVETITLRSPYRPNYCATELGAALLPFPWLPIKPPNIAGRVRGTDFVLKRMTLWADGGRPTAAGRFADAAPGTLIQLRVAAPAVGAYFLLLFTTAMAGLVIVALAAAVVSARVPVALVIGAAALLILMVLGVVASPLSPKVSFIRSAPEGDRFVAFFADVLNADLVTRD